MHLWNKATSIWKKYSPSKVNFYYYSLVSYKFTDCKAGFRVRYNVTGFVVKVRNLTHNHVVNEANYLADCRQRHLGTFERNRRRELCLYNCPSSDIREFARQEFNKHLTLQDVINLRLKVVPPCGPLKEIIDALAKAGEVRPHWNENNELECISFATREQIDLFQKFPEVIRIDATYNTNRCRYLSLGT